jgi:hypothetical protein
MSHLKTLGTLLLVGTLAAGCSEKQLRDIRVNKNNFI